MMLTGEKASFWSTHSIRPPHRSHRVHNTLSFSHTHTHTHLSGLSVVFPGCRCRNSRMVRSIQTSSADCLADTLSSFFLSFFLSSLPLAFYISHSHSAWSALSVCLSAGPVNLSQTDLKSLPHSLCHTVKLSQLSKPVVFLSSGALSTPSICNCSSLSLSLPLCYFHISLRCQVYN